jgi:hypothetical protein
LIHAEALFVSHLQASRRPAPDQVWKAISTTLRQHGIAGCAASVAEEFGEHPETAAKRMTWSLSTVHTVEATVPRGFYREYAR